MLENSLAELPEPQRRVLELAYIAGHSHAEIAAKLEEPLGTVKTRIRAGLTRMRRGAQPGGLIFLKKASRDGRIRTGDPCNPIAGSYERHKLLRRMRVRWRTRRSDALRRWIVLERRGVIPGYVRTFPPEVLVDGEVEDLWCRSFLARVEAAGPKFFAANYQTLITEATEVYRGLLGGLRDLTKRHKRTLERRVNTSWN